MRSNFITIITNLSRIYHEFITNLSRIYHDVHLEEFRVLDIEEEIELVQP